MPITSIQDRLANATAGFVQMTDRLKMQAASNDLIKAMREAPEGTDIEDNQIYDIASKYSLGSDRIPQLVQMVANNGAAQRIAMQKKAAIEQDELDRQTRAAKGADIKRGQALAEKTGLPSEQASTSEAAIRTAQGKPKEIKAPTTRKIQQGSEIVSQEWNPETGKWVEVGRGQKSTNVAGENIVTDAVDLIIKSGVYNPTTYSIRNNTRANIDNALRAKLEEMGKPELYGRFLQAGKFAQDAINARSIPLLRTAKAQVGNVRSALDALKPNEKVNTKNINSIIEAGKEARKNPDDAGNIWDKKLEELKAWQREQKLSPEQVAFEIAVFYYIRESNRALTGSSAVAQQSYDEEAAFMSRANSRDQLSAALDQSEHTLNNAIEARLNYYTVDEERDLFNRKKQQTKEGGKAKRLPGESVGEYLKRTRK